MNNYVLDILDIVLGSKKRVMDTKERNGEMYSYT